MKKVLLLGATSSIGFNAARCFAEDKSQFFLVARNVEKIQAVKDDLITRGASSVDWFASDLTDVSAHEELISKADDCLGGFDVVLIAWGSLGDEKVAQVDYAAAKEILDNNFLSVVSVLTSVSNRMEKRGGGTIAVISSVAGDRGRQSNYVYGSAKGALSIYLQGLRNRLFSKGVSVVTIKPGFVDTPMTAHLKKNFLFARPEEVGRGVYQAIMKGSSVVYLPWYWMFIMMIIKHIPEVIFKRLKL